MELFPAIDEEQFSFIQKMIDDCDYYVLILGGRYGNVGADGIGYTEMEYDYAIRRGLKVITLVHNATGSISVDKSEIQVDLSEKLSAFRKKVTTGRLAKFWNDRATLQAAFYESFSQTTSRYPATGWVRGNTVATEELLLQSNAIRNENEKLRAEISELRSKQAPTVENLAAIDAEYTVHYTYITYKGGIRSVSTWDHILIWRQIFSSFAPSILKPTPPVQIGPLLVSYMRERLCVKLIDHMITTDVDIIKIHFVALGLIDVVQSEAVGGGVTELIQITPKGQSVMIESLAVRATN